MTKRLILVASAAFAVALAAAAFVVPIPFASAGQGCDAGAWAPWAVPRLGVHRTEAFSHGGNCANAVVMIVVRGPNGAPLWSDSMPSAQLMTFAGIKSPREMPQALGEWLRQSHLFKSSADLPPWKKGETAPTSGEFAFYPDASIDRDAYEKTRSARVPVFCYVQGMESLACVVLEDGGMTKLGLQTFPG